MYAIIEEGGRQYKVTSGDRIRIDRMVGEGEKSVTFDRVLLVGGEGSPKIGDPLVGGATVTADVLGPVKGPKIVIRRIQAPKRLSPQDRARQHYLEVRVTGINA